MKTKTNIFTRQLFRSLILLLMMTGWSHCAWAIDDFTIDLTQKTPSLPEGVKQISYPQNAAGYDSAQHGWQWYAIEFQVSGAVTITVGGCNFQNTHYAYVTDANGTKLGDITNNKCDETYSFVYKGEAATLKLYCGQYCPYIKVEKFDSSSILESSNDYDAIVSNVGQLKFALNQANGTANKRYNIFVKNGEYDLGTAVCTAVKDYTTIVGESQDGVIIKNAPSSESINKTATLKTGSHVKLQNLTIKCRAPYTTGTGHDAERGICLQDCGTDNEYDNICLDGLQDTYYSNGAAGMKSTFNNCIIRGSVDFICGNGDITFNDCQLQIYPTHSGSTPVIAAPCTYTDTESQGFVFNNCTVSPAKTADIGCNSHSSTAVTAGDYYLARGWYAGNDGNDRTPRASFIGTTYTDNFTPKDDKWASAIDYGQSSDRSNFSDTAADLDLTSESANQNTPDGWTAVQLPSIKINKVITPTLEEGEDKDNATAIQAAIDKASGSVGGKVIIPSGTWLSGPLVMKSNVVLHLSKNTTLKMLPYDADSSKGYPHVKDSYFIGTGDASAENVIIEGEDQTSIIDGQGEAWWNAYEQDNNLVRPAAMIRFRQGSKFLVRNLKMQNAPQTNLTLGESGKASHFTVHDVTIVNPSSVDSEATADEFNSNSHNTDGIPVWGPYANIYKCNISTGDDNVVFDSNSQYCHVWDCDFGRGHGASIGSYTENVHHILWDNIRFKGTESGFKIKSQHDRSGDLHDITFQNSTMDGVQNILYLDCWYDRSDKPTPGKELEENEKNKQSALNWHDITFKNITATNCQYKESHKNGFPIYFYGLPNNHIKNVTLDKVTIEGQKGMFLAYVDEINFNGCSITNVKEDGKYIATQHKASWQGDFANIPLPRTGTWNFATTKGDYDYSNKYINTNDGAPLAMEIHKEGNATLRDNSNSLQVSDGIYFKVPVQSTSDVVTVTNYGDAQYNMTYTVGSTTVDNSSDNNERTFNPTSEDVGRGYLTIKATNAGYVKSISVEQKENVTEIVKEWNFSDWNECKAENMPNSLEKDGLEVYPIVDGNGSKKSAIENNKKTIDDYSFTKRFKFGGQSTSAAAGSGYIKFEVTGPTDIIVYGMCGNNQKTSVLYLSTSLTSENKCPQTDGKYLHKWSDVGGSAIDKYEYSYDGNASPIYLYCGENSANIYCIKTITRQAGQLTSEIATVQGKEHCRMGLIDAYKTYKLEKGTDFTTNSGAQCSFTSSDESVAKVASNGTITAVGPGQATITISQPETGAFSAGSCTVTVHVFKDFDADFSSAHTTTNILTGESGNLNFGIALDANGKAEKVAADSPRAIATVTGTYITGTYNGSHGIQNMVCNVHVPGAVKITLGTCSYDENASITVDGEEKATFTGDKNNNCWKNNPENIQTVSYTGEAKEIKISKNNGYVAYLKIELMTGLPVNVKVDPEGAGTVDGAGDSYTPGSEVKLTAKPNAGYRFGHFLDGTTQHTDNPYTFTMGDTEKTLTAHFTELEKVTFNTEGAGATGSAPATLYANSNGQFTIPANQTLYKQPDQAHPDGYTLTHWTDGNGNNYEPGKTYKLESDLTLTPVFTPNTVNIYDVSEERKVTWQLGEKNGAPSLNFENSTGYYIVQATVCGTVVDVPLYIDASSGKFNNKGRKDKWAQTNKGLKLTLPSLKGAVVEFDSYNDNIASVEGTTLTSSNKHHTSSPIQTEEKTVNLNVESDTYLSTITVTYPATKKVSNLKAEKQTITVNKDGTYTLTKDTDFSTSSTGAVTYSSSVTDVATIDSSTGEITAKAYGETTITISQAKDATYAPGTATIKVKVISATGQTAKPEATISTDGSLTISCATEGATILYTLDGSEPKEDNNNAKKYTGAISSSDAQGKVVTIAAYHGENSPSDIVKAYINVPGTLTWPWETGALQTLPTISGEGIEAILDKGTKMEVGKKLNNPGIKNGGQAFEPMNGIACVNPDEEATLTFHIIPIAGIQFKPTEIKFNSQVVGTSSGLLDIDLITENSTHHSLADWTPTKDEWTDKSLDVKNFKYASEWTMKYYIYALTKNKQMAFKDITVTGTFSGVEYDGQFYTISTSAEPIDGGKVTHTPSAIRVMPESKVTLTATPNNGYRFVGWTDYATGKQLQETSSTLTIPSVKQDINYQANFEKLPKVTFSLGKVEMDGTLPADTYTDNTLHFTIPQNTTLYKKGYALAGWKDSKTETIYPIGENPNFAEDVTLTPYLTVCDKALTDTDNPLTATWHFDQKDGAPVISIGQNGEASSLIYTKSVTVGGSMIDVPLVIAGAKATNDDARLNHVGDRDKKEARGGQLNKGATLTIPAVYGMEVKLTASDKADYENVKTAGAKPNETYFAHPSGETIQNLAQISFTHKVKKTGDDGAEKSSWETTSGETTKEPKVLTFIYKGDADSLKLTVDNGGSTGTYGYFRSLSVTYPALPDVKLENKIVSRALADREEKAENACKSVTVTKSSATRNTGNRYKPGETVTITATPGYGYTVSAIKTGDTSLNLATTEGSETQTAQYTVPETTATLTVEYKRKPMAKVRLFTADKTLGTVDFAEGDIHDNFYLKHEEESFVESYFVAGSKVTAQADAADEYVISKWTVGEKGESVVSTSSNFSITVPAAKEDGAEETVDSVDYYAHFIKGIPGTVRFRLKDDNGNWIAKVYKRNANGDIIMDADGKNKKYEILTLDDKSQAPADRENCGSFYIPKYYTIFKTYDAQKNEKGWTLKYWVNKDNPSEEYALGSNNSFTESRKEITLIPVFEENPGGMNNRLTEPVITYEFGTVKGIRAQKLDLKSSSDTTYYSTKVNVPVMENGKIIEQIRDVALWINTGEKGYVRNEGLDEWAAMGPGTTLQIVSCAGTKIEIYTYSPITSTTIDGVVPQDVEKTDDGYIYSYTTNSTNPRVPIVIGDDYSYYKRVKAHTLMASRVNLHVSEENDGETNGKTKGEILEVEPMNISGTEINENNPPMIDLEDGGKSFIQGDRVTVRFERKFGYVFDKIIDPDKIVNGEPLAVLEMKDDGKVWMVKLGDSREREEVLRNTDGTWGDSEKNVFMLKEIEPNDDDKAAGLRTQYEVQFNITTHRNLVFCFKEKPTYYVTFNAGQEATGTAPSAILLEKGDKFTVPVNKTLYYSGHTLKYWRNSKYDESKSIEDNLNERNAYRLNTAYTLDQDMDAAAQKEDYNLRLYPVFESNEFSLFDEDLEDKSYTATWDFRRDQGAPSIYAEGGVTTLLVTQIKKDENTFIDWKIELDAQKLADSDKKPKFDNRNDATRCQINPESILRFPVAKGSEITLAGQKPIFSTNIAGSVGKKSDTDSGYEQGTTVNVTYTGENGNQSIVFKSDCGYYYYLSVSYRPQKSVKPVLENVTVAGTPIDENKLSDLKTKKSVTIDYCPIRVNDNKEEVTDDKGFVIEEFGTVVATTAEGKGKVEVIQPTIENPRAVIMLKTDGGSLTDTYEVNFNLTAHEGKNPNLLYVEINGTKYDDFANGIDVKDMPPSGYFRLVFDRTMKEKTIPFQNNSSTSKQGREQTFYYWDMVNLTDRPIKVPENYFEDIYGNKYDKPFSMTFSTRSTVKEIKHRKFDFIVGEDGTLAEAIAAANSNKESDAKRYFIYVPDGEYKLEGNEPLTNYGITSDGKWPCDEKGQPVNDMQGKNNGMTMIRRPKVSLIGQSRDGVTIWNKPMVEGIGYTATLHIAKDNDGRASDFYAQDISLENRFDYWGCVNGGSSAARAVAFWDQGQRTTMKNVSMMSWQDTYYSSNASADYHGYFEDCRLGGIIDWACGDGNIWFENCDIVIRDRSGNNFAAPSQEKEQQWGYVLSNCHFKPELPLEEMTNLKDKTWTIARPWVNGDKSPACVLLNTYMHVLPKDAGWGSMNANSVLRFQEYHSTDGSGNILSLGARSLAASNPAPGSYDCVLNETEAARFSVHNVMSGADIYDPVERTKQIDAKSGMPETDDDANDIETASQNEGNRTKWDDQIEIDDDRLQWNCENTALCYFVFKLEGGKWMYKAQVVQDEGAEKAGISLDQNNLGAGTYCVRAANQYGGLGTPTESIVFTNPQRYTLTLKQLGDLTVDDKPYGYSTICLDYNAKAPEGATVYAVTAQNKKNETDKVTTYYVTLKTVNLLTANKGYVVYGPAGEYVFKSTSHSDDTPTILRGNPSNSEISSVNNNCYVLANKSFGLGFYKYTGAKLRAHLGWLPADMVDTNVNYGTASGAKGIRFSFSDGSDLPTGLRHLLHGSSGDDRLYNISGQRIRKPAPRTIYITPGKGKAVAK